MVFSKVRWWDMWNVEYLEICGRLPGDLQRLEPYVHVIYRYNLTALEREEVRHFMYQVA